MTDRVGMRLYPRGFIGGLPAPRVERMAQPSLAEQLLSHRFQVNSFRPSDTTTYSNPEVEALYATLMKQSPEVQTFEYRNKVLTVALKAFGTKDFQYWMAQQRTSPSSGERHRRFLHDMIRFLKGERRELPLNVWASLLDIDVDGGNQTRDPYVEEFFATYPQANHLVNVLQMWCQRQNGIEDLIVTLHLLFGDF